MNNRIPTRRRFLADVGKGVLAVSAGAALSTDLGLSSALAEEAPATLSFGALDPLVALMQETPVDKLLPLLTQKLSAGIELKTLVAAGALANARKFGGEDYVGFHTLMALAPAWHMSRELPAARQALPVFKVLHRNTKRMQETGGRKNEALHPVEPMQPPAGKHNPFALRDAVRSRDLAAAERNLAALNSPDAMLNDLMHAVEDDTEVHRIVLPYRAWDMLDLIGMDHAQVLLRQSVRYCLKSENHPGGDARTTVRALLPKLLEEHRLLASPLGNKPADDKWIDELSQLILKSPPAQAAGAVAAALSEGINPADIAQSICLAANQLLLRDIGRTAQESPGKPMGSVHGDSIGVHACDSANAWRNLARVSNPRNTCACLILGAYQVALDRINRGGDFLNWQPLPLAAHLSRVEPVDAAALLNEADDAIRNNLQARAAAVAHRYGQLGHSPRAMFDVMLKYAISEDGSLHAEKFYRTTTEEFAAARPAFKWRYMVALARVTASEYGKPAPGNAQARELLKL